MPGANDDENDDDDLEALRIALEHVERGLNERRGILFVAGADGRNNSNSNSINNDNDNNSDSNTNQGSSSSSSSSGGGGGHLRSGRALFESIGSSLGSIRARLHALTGSSGSSSNEASGTAPPIDGSLRDLSQRLETAERSHSTRAPLQWLQSQSQSQSQEGSLLTEQEQEQQQQQQQQQQPSRPPPPRSVTRQASSLLASRTRNDQSTSSEIAGSSGASLFSSSHALAASIRLSEGSFLPTLDEGSSAEGRSIEVVLERRIDDNNTGKKNDDDDDDDASSETDPAETGTAMPVSELLLPESARKSLRDETLSRRGSLKVLSEDLMVRFAALGGKEYPMETEPCFEHGEHAPSELDCKDHGCAANDDADSDSNGRVDVPPVVPEAELYTWGSLTINCQNTPDDHEMNEDANDGSSSHQCSRYEFFGSGARLQETPDLASASPQRIPPDARLGRSEIVSLSGSETHFAFVTSSGMLLACGNNAQGAVDPSRIKEARVLPVPTHLEVGLGMNRIKTVACGRDHTAVVTEVGSVLTWGSNRCGQLGHRRALRHRGTLGTCVPKAFVLGTNGRHLAADVACCDDSTLVLTTRMEVYSAGDEKYECDYEYNYESDVDKEEFFPLPKEFAALQGVPLVGIASGANHSVVWTAHGTAYAWGSNEAGQCGREFPRNLNVPVPIAVPKSSLTSYSGSSLASVSVFLENWNVWAKDEPIGLARDVRIVDVACGKEHTVLLTESGRLLVCGSNQRGQLGLSAEDSASTRKQSGVLPVTHPDPERRFESVQAGTSHTLLLDDIGSVWETGNGTRSIKKIPTLPCPVSSIVAGGSISFAIAKATSTFGPQSTISSMPGLDDLIDAIRTEETRPINGRPSPARSSIDDLASRTEELFRSPAVMNSLFMDPKEIDTMSETLIHGSHTQEVRQRIVSSIEQGMRMGLKSMVDSRLIYFESVRFLLMYLQCPLWRETAGQNKGHSDGGKNEFELKFDERGDLLFLLCETILGLPFEGYKAFLAWSATVYGEELFVPFLVQPLVHQLNSRLLKRITHGVPMIGGVLLWLYTINERSDDRLANPEDFYCSGIETMPMEALFEDLRTYHMATDSQRSSNFFLSAHPFLMAPTVKQNLLQVEHQMSMVEAAQAAGVSFDQRTRQFQFKPYFVLAIDRKYLLPQTLQAVANASTGELRKSLKVVFKGEDGIDAGGVTKEFFQLLCEKLFDVNTGMWTISESNDTWFNSDCTWNGEGYYLVGVLCGLAVYNSVILDVHFPHAIYRKLLGLPLGLEDLIDEDVRKGLKILLDYDGDDAEFVFCLDFEVSWMDLGQERKKELKPGGSNIAVTSANKEEYVMLYVKWLLVDSVASQYGEFERGFNQVMAESSLDILTAEELDLLVTGTPVLDFGALEQSCEYEGGFDADSAVVKNVWKWVRSTTLPTQEKFLRFCTGSSKGPMGGLGEMPFKIQRAGPDSSQLPTAHTCFNTLIVPDYGDNYDKLSDRLGRAIIECEGFGLQ